MWIIETVDVFFFVYWITAKFSLYFVSSQTPLYYVGDDGDRWSGQCIYWRHICRHAIFWYVMFVLCVFAINWTTCSMPTTTSNVFKYVKLCFIFAKLRTINLNELLYSFAHFADKICIPWWLVLWHAISVDVSSILGTMISLATSQQRKHSLSGVWWRL